MVPARNRQLCEIIREHYEEQGRLWASVTLEEGQRPQDTRVVFRIQEGPRAVVRDIVFVGNHFYTDRQLAKKVSPSHAAALEAINHDVKELIKHYHQCGFVDVSVNYKLKKARTPREAQLIFSIEEGYRYQVSAIQFEGDWKVDRDRLRALLPIHCGECYDEQKAEAGEKKICEALGHAGKTPYVRMDWFRQTSKTSDGQLVVVYQVMKEHPRHPLGNIIIKGNNSIPRKVILQQIAVRPGEKLTGKNLYATQKNLAKLFGNHFRMDLSANLELTAHRFDIATLDLIISIEDQEQSWPGGIISGANDP
jgi:outer membrane protein insertion porin family